MGWYRFFLFIHPPSLVVLPRLPLYVRQEQDVTPRPGDRIGDWGFGAATGNAGCKYPGAGTPGRKKHETENPR